MTQPKLQRLFLKNYKNLDFADDGLALDNLNILIGANGSGKTNLIDALKFLK